MVGDLVTGMDDRGDVHTGEVVNHAGGLVLLQPERMRDVAGNWIDLPPVMVRARTCTIVECQDQREGRSLRDARIARWQQTRDESRER